MPKSSLALVAAVAWLAAPMGAWAQDFAGSAACAGCHAEQAAAQAGSAHARALTRPAGHRLAERFSAGGELRRPPGFASRYERADGRLEAEVRFGERARRQVVDWAFGAGDQAVTFVSRLDDEWHVEHYWSYYTELGGFGPTPGHQTTEADDLGQALGVMYRTFSPQSEMLRCFRCHSTGPLSLDDELGIVPAEAGVRCEACHGPGARHAAEVAAGRTEAARTSIANPGRLTPRGLLTACGACHRPPAAEPSEIDYRDPWNVRHQPLYLVRSKCFDNGGLTCMSCHDPHGDLVRGDSAFYDAKCANCHASESCAGGGRGECASCHMPQVRPQDGLVFTNHWIGVFSSGEAFLPRR